MSKLRERIERYDAVNGFDSKLGKSKSITLKGKMAERQKFAGPMGAGGGLKGNWYA